MKPKKSLAQWLSFFLLGVSFIVIYKMFDSLSEIGGVIGKLFSILTPFVIGFVIAFLLYGPVKWFERLFFRSKAKWMHKIARPISVTIVYLLFFGVVALVVYLVIPALVRALVDFINSVPTYYNNVMAFVDEYNRPGGLLEGFDVRGKIAELYAWVQGQLTVERILSYVSSVVSLTSSIVDVFMALVVSVYMLLGKESLFSAVRSVSGLFMRKKTINFVSGYLEKISRIFNDYVYSQLIDACVVGVLATIGYLLGGMPNAPALGIMLGLLNLIPYFGALIGGAISVLIALLSGNVYSALFIGVYILVMQQIDANIIQPRIVGQTVGIKAIYVLLGITVCGGLFGFWGILLGAPVMAVAQMIVTDCIEARQKPQTDTWSLPEEEKDS